MMSPHLANLSDSHLKLSPQQQRVIEFIDRNIAEGHGFPATTAIAQHMGWKKTESAKDSLHKLRWRGLVRVAADYSWQRVTTKTDGGLNAKSTIDRGDTDARRASGTVRAV